MATSGDLTHDLGGEVRVRVIGGRLHAQVDGARAVPVEYVLSVLAGAGFVADLEREYGLDAAALGAIVALDREMAWQPVNHRGRAMRSAA